MKYATSVRKAASSKLEKEMYQSNTRYLVICKMLCGLAARLAKHIITFWRIYLLNGGQWVIGGQGRVLKTVWESKAGRRVVRAETIQWWLPMILRVAMSGPDNNEAKYLRMERMELFEASLLSSLVINRGMILVYATRLPITWGMCNFSNFYKIYVIFDISSS